MHHDNLNYSMNEVRTLTLSEICKNNTCYKKTTTVSSKTVFSTWKHFPPLNLKELKLPLLLTFYHPGFCHVSNALNYENIPPLENCFLLYQALKFRTLAMKICRYGNLELAVTIKKCSRTLRIFFWKQKDFKINVSW